MPICVYCAQEVPAVTDDHVFPRSFFADEARRLNVEKWKVPACRPCNNKYSKVEESVLLRLAACLNPNDPASAGLWPRMRRSMRPAAARVDDEKDQRARAAKLKHFVRDVSEIQSMPEEGVLPSFRANYGDGSRIKVRISAEELDLLAEKWVRGVHYRILGRIIVPPASIDILHFLEKDAHEAMEKLRPNTRWYTAGPDVEVAHAFASDGSDANSYYELSLWGQFKVHASVEEPALGKQEAPSEAPEANASPGSVDDTKEPASPRFENIDRTRARRKTSSDLPPFPYFVLLCRVPVCTTLRDVRFHARPDVRGLWV